MLLGELWVEAGDILDDRGHAIHNEGFFVACVVEFAHTTPQRPTCVFAAWPVNETLEGMRLIASNSPDSSSPLARIYENGISLTIHELHAMRILCHGRLPPKSSSQHRATETPDSDPFPDDGTPVRNAVK